MTAGRMFVDPGAEPLPAIEWSVIDPPYETRLDRLRAHQLYEVALAICRRHFLPIESVFADGGRLYRSPCNVKCRDEVIAAAYEWRKWNPQMLGKVFKMAPGSIKEALRRHRGEQPRKVPAELRALIIQRDGLTCRICLLPVERDDVHVDHIVPAARGGSISPENLQVTHSLCNIRKGHR